MTFTLTLPFAASTFEWARAVVAPLAAITAAIVAAWIAAKYAMTRLTTQLSHEKDENHQDRVAEAGRLERQLLHDRQLTDLSEVRARIDSAVLHLEGALLNWKFRREALEALTDSGGQGDEPPEAVTESPHQADEAWKSGKRRNQADVLRFDKQARNHMARGWAAQAVLGTRVDGEEGATLARDLTNALIALKELLDVAPDAPDADRNLHEDRAREQKEFFLRDARAMIKSHLPPTVVDHDSK